MIEVNEEKVKVRGTRHELIGEIKGLFDALVEHGSLSKKELEVLLKYAGEHGEEAADNCITELLVASIEHFSKNKLGKDEAN